MALKTPATGKQASCIEINIPRILSQPHLNPADKTPSCHNYTEALHARQRDIAVLVNHVRSFDKGGEPDESEQNANTPDIPSSTLAATPARKPTRKERKQAKAAVRAANLAKKAPNKISAAEIEHVAKVMREEPRAARLLSLQMDGADDDDDAEEDTATSPSKASTHPPVLRVKGRRQSLLSVQTEEEKHEHAMMILKSLGVKVEVKGATRARKNALGKLVEGIRGYYVWLGAERADVEMRGEGFLKFAGNQAFRTIMDILEENRVWRAQGERAASGGGQVREDGGEDAGEWEGRGVWENWGWVDRGDAGEVEGEEGANGEADGEVFE